MNVQHAVKILGGFSASVALLLLVNGCSSSKTSTAESPQQPNSAEQQTASFASSTICADNPFLQKYQCSFSRVEQSARAGDPDAQYALGYLYYYGIGTTQDRQTGLVWIRKAAAQGQSVAQQALKELSGGSSAKSSTSAPKQNGAAVTSSTAPVAHTQPERPLTDYLPNYGEKRVNTTQTPPSVNLSTPPSNQ